MPPRRVSAFDFRLRARRTCRGSGFTLLEMLAACGVAVLILTLALRIFSSTLELWRHSELRSETFREARAALDLMARDLRMTTRLRGEPALRFAHDADTPEADRVNEAVSAIISRPGLGKGELCAVAYRCLWDEAAHGYVLKRRFRDHDTLFADLARAKAAGLHDPTQATEEDAARFVCDLTIRPCADGVAAAAYPNAAYTGKSPGELPMWIEIRFKALGPGAAEKLKSLPVTRETWSNRDDPLFRRVIQPYLQTFSARVPLHAANRE